MKKKYRKERYKTKEEWLENRGLGGSSCSALFEANPYLSKLDIYCAFTNPAERRENNTQTASTIYGSECESVIRDLVKINFKGKYIVKKPKNYEMYRRIDKPFLTASLDSELIEEGTRRKGVLEIKTYEFRGNADLEENWGIAPPIRYQLQVLHYLMVMNDYDFAKLVVKIRYLDFDTGDVIKEEIRYYHFERKDNEEQIAQIEAVETDFWENNIMQGNPPDLIIKVNTEEL